MQFDWREGNQTHLAIQKTQLIDHVLQALNNAKQQVLLETNILDESPAGAAVCQKLCQLAQLGLFVLVRLDAHRAQQMNSGLLAKLAQAGVQLSLFQSGKNRYRQRLHRRLLVIDQQTAFIGGCNFSPLAQQDGLPLQLSGPIVADIARLIRAPLTPKKTHCHWWSPHYPEPRLSAQGSHKGTVSAQLIPHFNTQTRRGLETHLLKAIHGAHTRISILTKHFCPSPKLLSALIGAARRGVHVRLWIPKPRKRGFQHLLQRLFEHAFHDAGVQLHTYQHNPLGSNVMLVDQDWLCIGSSNLDPQSLKRNLEADLLLRNHSLNQQLQNCLAQLPCSPCNKVARNSEQQSLGLSRLTLDSLYYLRRCFAPLDRQLALAALPPKSP